ncbi:MAG: signal peptidase I [Verrucomicrobia bacterium]|nr:MAG: signal peptidase I [Verrucomicrobiota bacterium]
MDYSYSSQGNPPSPLSVVVGLLIALLLIVAMWKVFTKAGQPGWASIIPIYNLYIWCKIVGRPGWWILLMLIPFVNIIVGIILCIDMARSFGKGAGFGIGLALLGIIFWPILGFGSAQYQGPTASAEVAVVPPPQPA